VAADDLGEGVLGVVPDVALDQLQVVVAHGHKPIATGW
jgi:hypothetical protein